MHCSTRRGVISCFSPSGMARHSLSSSVAMRQRSLPIDSAMMVADWGEIVLPRDVTKAVTKAGSSRSATFLLSKTTPTAFAFARNLLRALILPFLWQKMRMVCGEGCSRYFSSSSVFFMFCASFTMMTLYSAIMGNSRAML